MAQAPADLPAAVHAAFAALRQRFVAGLPARWQAIAAAAPGPVQLGLLHQRVGAAGSYGLTALSAAAREAEQAANTGACTELEAALQALQRQLGEACYPDDTAR